MEIIRVVIRGHQWQTGNQHVPGHPHELLKPMAFVRTKVELKRTRRTATCGIRDNEVLLVGGQPAEQRRLLGLVEPAVLLL